MQGCATPAPPHYSPLQLQVMQTSQFSTTKRQLFDAVNDVLQNHGYTIQTANLSTGLITAQSPTSSKKPKEFHSTSHFNKQEFEYSVETGLAEVAIAAAVNSAFHSSPSATLQPPPPPPPKYMYTTKVTAFITMLNHHKSQVRFNFVIHQFISGGHGQQSITDQPIEDPNFYQHVFNAINAQLIINPALDSN